MRPVDAVLISLASMLLGAGVATMAWSVWTPEGTPLWDRSMTLGSALAIGAAMVGCVGTILTRRRQRQA
ncbi:hypothetical protein BIU90_02525 [Curtobacterium sp. MCBA15_001]|nr:hypothetical protein BIU90_02525 [Curtobacterium sp. MCBA15_001]